MKLRLDTKPSENLEVYVDGKQFPRLTKEGFVFLDPGEHTVKIVDASGKTVFSGQYESNLPGEEKFIELKMELLEETKEKPKKLKERWALWSGIASYAAGTILVGIGLSFTHKTKKHNEDLEEAREHTSSTVDVCECFKRVDTSSCYFGTLDPDYQRKVLDICDSKTKLHAGQIALYSIGTAFLFAGLGFIIHDLRENVGSGGSTASLKTKNKHSRLSLSVSPIFDAALLGISFEGTF